MDKRKRRRQRKNAFEQFINIVKTIVLIVIAGAVVFLVIRFIGQSTGAELGGDSKISEMINNAFKSGDDETAAESETVSGDGLNVDGSFTEGINTDKDGHTVYVRDGNVVKDCWIEADKALYRMDADGYAVTGEYEEDAYIYTFSSGGKLTEIRRNGDYKDSNSTADYGLVEKDGLKVFLDQNKGLGRFSSIKYKKGSVSHYLGGETNMQYTLAGSVQIDDEGYIYWLPLTDSPDELESRLNGTLYRMKPGEEKREIVVKGVTGYRVLTGENGSTIIYYYKSGGSLGRCGSGNCKVDESVIDFTEDLEYEPVISDGKIYLQTVSGYRVTKAFDEFTTGGFTYKIAEDGEILSVAENHETVLEGKTYSILSDEAFGIIRNVVIRKTEEKTEKISGEFKGECYSLFANEKDGKIYGEFLYEDGSPHLFVVTKDGDVDLLKDTDVDTVSVELYGFTKSSAFVKNTYTDGTVKFEEISTSDTSPIALGIDPVDITDEKPDAEAGSEYEYLGPGYQQPSVGASPSSENISEGPGALPAPTAEIPDQPVIVTR